MIKELIQRWRIRRTFSGFISEEGLNDILSAKLDETNVRKLKESQLEFVLVAVRGHDAQQISERMGIVADLGVQHKGLVDCLVSSLVVMVFGMAPHDSDKNRFTFVSALHEKLGKEVKIVHGSERGHVGMIGGNVRLSHSFIIPSFLEAIEQLIASDFGDIKELSKPG